MNLETFATILGIIISIGGTFAAVSQFYRNRIQNMINLRAVASKKEYAAERDFAHLQKNYEHLQSSLDKFLGDTDTRLERLEIRFVRVETLMQILSRDMSGDSVDTTIKRNERQ